MEQPENSEHMKPKATLNSLSVVCIASIVSLAIESSHADLVDAGIVLIDVNVDRLSVGSTPSTLPNTGSVIGSFDLVNEAGQAQPEIVEITDTNTITLKGIHLNRETVFQNVFKGPVTPAELTAAAATRSIEVWANNPDITNNGEEMMVAWGRRGGGDGTNMSFGFTNQAAFGAVGHWGGGPDMPWGDAGAGTPTTGDWHHLVYTYDGATTSVYSDGAFVFSEATGSIDTHDGFPFLIGGQNAQNAPHDPTVTGVGAGSFGGNFSGVVSRVRIHDGVLAPADVISNFNNGPGSDPAVDTDGDGISDRIEDLHACLDKDVKDADADPDNDDLSNIDELGLGTDPCEADSDGDDVSDGDEVNRVVGVDPAPTDPLNPDTDGDGLNDGVETNTGADNGATDRGTDPLVADGDSDGLSDGDEITSTNTNPFDPDSDHDNFDDGFEIAAGTNPNDIDEFPASGPVAVAEELLVNLHAAGLAVGDLTVWPQTGETGAEGDFENAANHLTQIAGFLGDSLPVVEDISAPLGIPSQMVPGRVAGSEITIRAVSFSGDDGMIGPMAPAGVTGTDPTRTIEVWAYNEIIPNEEVLVSWSERGGPDGTAMQLNYGNDPSFGAVTHWGGGLQDISWTDNTASVTAAPAASSWQHLVYTYDGTTTRVYTNGILQNEEELGAGLVDTHALDDDGITPFPFRLAHAGNDDGTPALGASASLAAVRVHDGVLTREQALNNYLAGPDALPPGLGAEFKITAISRDPGTEFVSLTWTSRPGRRYAVFSSVDMTSWREVEDTVPASAGDTTSFIDSAGNPPGAVRRFYQVRDATP